MLNKLLHILKHLAHFFTLYNDGKHSFSTADLASKQVSETHSRKNIKLSFIELTINKLRHSRKKTSGLEQTRNQKKKLQTVTGEKKSL